MREASEGGTGESFPTLLHRVWREGDEFGLFSHLPPEYFEQSPRIEASSAFEFFWGERRGDMRMGLDAFPSLGVPIGLMVFVEGRPPSRSPFGDVDGRIGFAVVRTDRQAAKSYGMTAELELMLATKTSATFLVQPFWESGRTLETAPVAWHVPLKLDGRAAASKTAPHPVLSRGGPDDYEIVMPDSDDTPREVRTATVDMLGGALFTICCMNIVGPDPTSGLVRWSGNPPMDISLDVGPLAERLRSKGRADQLGLGHALAVCRADLLPSGPSHS